jgi:4-hydroxy-tetrahydrodipicolinate synthase
LFSLGANGIISASANIIPAQFVQLDSLLRSGKFQEAFILQKWLYPLIKTLFAETNPAPLKFALEKMGRGLNRLRLPLVPVQKETQEKIYQQLVSLELVS